MTRVLIIGGGGVPMDKVGSFNPALMVHGEQGIELFDEIPPDGEIESTGECTAIWDKGNAAVVEFESTSINTATGKPLQRRAVRKRRGRDPRRTGPAAVRVVRIPGLPSRSMCRFVTRVTWPARRVK